MLKSSGGGSKKDTSVYRDGLMNDDTISRNGEEKYEQFGLGEASVLEKFQKRKK